MVETKGSTWWGDLRQAEGAKIKCNEKHFDEMPGDDAPAQYIKAVDVDSIKAYVD